MILKQIEEITKIRDSARLVSKTLGLMAREIKPGVNSLYLDKIAEEFILDNDGKIYSCGSGYLGHGEHSY